ncbi:MAG: hypothetical protein ACLSBH_16655 [Coprobacillus cateniformis]
MNQDGQVSSHTYNSDNQLTSTVEDGQKTQFIYNNQGQLVNEGVNRMGRSRLIHTVAIILFKRLTLMERQQNMNMIHMVMSQRQSTLMEHILPIDIMLMDK